MAQRIVALCNGKYIGIETIYTVINGRQINIPEKLKELRAQSQRNELFCPCGCGTNLILVAEYSVAAKPSVRKNGNHLSGQAETALGYCYVRRSRLYVIVPEMDPVHKPPSWKYPFLGQDS